ncbi:porin [Saccharicrinis carchari]|nr:porin [Saccharicrinis carchari]
MKIKNIITTIVLFLGFTLVTFSQERTAFEPSGKPILKIFSNYHSTFSEGEIFNQFQIKRAYLGYAHTFSKKWSARVIFDVGNPKDGGQHQLAAYVKNALVNYKNAGLSVSFGLIGTTAFKTQEQQWGYRYLLKSFQNRHNFVSSADIGISAAYQFNNIISADLIMVNGEGHKKIEQDSIFSIGAGLTINPIDALTLRAYYETTTQEKDSIKRQNTSALFVGYQFKKLALGAEYSLQTNRKMKEGVDWHGFSFFSTLQIKSAKLFARFDKLKSKADWNTDSDGHLFIIGAEFNPVKGIKIAPNFRTLSPAADNAPHIKYAYINCEISF